jgi:PAS domain-containing protein
LPQLLASMAGAVIVLDRRGGILQMTPPAEALLGEHDGLLICKGSKGSSHTTLCAHMREDSARLTTRIRRALAVACGELQDLDGTLQIRRPSGRCALLVQVTRCRRRHSPHGARSTAVRAL